MKKGRIATRIKDKTGIAKSKNRSEDLVALRQQYQQFAKNLKFLISTLTTNRSAMAAFSKSRLEVAKAINALTVDTPLFKCAGDIPANAVGTTDGGADSETVVAYQANPTSYAAVHLQLHKKNKMYQDKFTEHILNYATEWERILSTRIAGHLKHSEKLRVDLDHYGRKVEELNKSMNKTMSKGKSVVDKGVDKLKRNEQKLIQARQEYDRFINDLCGFMEEVMERGWKDLHPLLIKMAQFDSTLSNDESTLLRGSMATVTEEMKAMGTKYPNMKPMGRLKELETWSLESLNKVNPSMRSESPLMITQGAGDAASYVTGTGDTGGSTGIHASLTDGPPDDGSSVGGGMYGSRMMSESSRQGSLSSAGGYDWANEAASQQYARAGSFRSAPNSGGLPPLPNPQRSLSSQDISATSTMLTTMQAAAPPPTVDDIWGPTGNGTAPPPAGMPPPPPAMPPPPPPQALLSPALSQMSIGGVTNASFMSPGGQSAAGSIAGSNTNPFDDTFGSAPASHHGGYGGPSTPSHGNPYGGTNPFG